MRVKDYSFVQSVYTKCCFLMFVEFSFIFLDFIIYRIRKLLKTHMRITLIENVVIKKLFRITFEGSNVSLIFFLQSSTSFRIKNLLLLISRFLINTQSRPFRANRPRFLHFPPRSGGREVGGNKEASSQQRKVNGVIYRLAVISLPRLQPPPPDAYSSDFFSPAPFPFSPSSTSVHRGVDELKVGFLSQAAKSSFASYRLDDLVSRFITTLSLFLPPPLVSVPLISVFPTPP